MDEQNADLDPDLDVDHLEYLQSLTAAERVRRLVDAAELVRRSRRAGARLQAGAPQTAD